LEGTNSKAEGVSSAIQSDTSSSNTVNYSGPINKLLPQDIQFIARANTVNQAMNTRHDQVVGCSFNISVNDLNSLLLTFGITLPNIQILDFPIPCYGNNPLLTQFITRHYLSEWKGNTPPLLSQYKDQLDYWKAYKTWQGNACNTITIPGFVPIIGNQKMLICINNLTVSKYLSYLYSYIPYSSTEDLQGSISIDNVSSATSPTTSGVTVNGVTFSGQKPSTLFFFHMAESNQDAALLQNTFAPQGADEVGNPTNISSNTTCNTLDVRSNKGDNLFASQLSGDLSYTAKFSCQFNAISSTSTNCKPNGSVCTDGTECCSGSCTPEGINSYCMQTVQTCTKDVYIALSTESSTPDVDDIWSRLVAGPMAIFKRIFPETNTTDSVGTIIDIPGSTSITYSAAGVSQDSADLKLPHLGGISEYFLKGIQTALRPKGFGDTIEFAQTTASSCTGGTLPTLPAGQGSCTLKSSDTLPTGAAMPPTLKAILEAAGQSYNVPPSLILGVMYGEGAFNPGKYDWTEDNVKAWSTGCATMPSCNQNTFPSQGPVPFFAPYWNNLKDAVKVVDPERTPNPCNLMDTIFALAKDLASDQYGSNDFAGKTCYGINLNSGSSNSSFCNWSQSDVETAIRIWEFGTVYNDTCGTKVGGCANGGYASACDGDICEKVGGSGNTSHNACVWNIANTY
jgi:hypothetical protein